MTIDQLMRAYDDGDITRNELFGHVLALLTPGLAETVRARLRGDEGLLEAFEEWVDDVAAGAEVFLGSRQVHFSDDSRSAIALWRERTRAARYAKLAGRMTQWRTNTLQGEPTINPEDIEPFRSKDIDGLFAEAA